MNKLELLKKQLEMLNDMISMSTDEAKQKSYIKERDELNKEIGKEELRIEQAEKAAKDQQEKDAAEARNKAAGSPLAASHVIKVGEPDMYKGVRIKQVVGDIDLLDVRPEIKAGFKARPERSMGLVKHFADLYDQALRSKAINEGTPTAGGYLTPTEQRAELLSYVREMSVVAGDCTHIPMTSDVMTVPAENAKVTGVWTAEATAATEASPTFTQVTLTAKKWDAFTTVSNELIEDNNIPGGITAMLISQFTEATAKEIDKQVLVGTGNPVSGIFTSQAGYSEVFSAGSTAFSELLESNLRALIAKIPPERLDGAKWYAHNSVVWNYFYGLKDSNGRNLFIPSNAGSVPGTFFGYPAKQSSQATSASASGATMAAFGNLKGFYIGDRLTNISLLVDPYSLGKNYQTNFYFFTRWAFAHALPGYYGRIVTA